jgi:hypothetical protein
LINTTWRGVARDICDNLKSILAKTAGFGPERSQRTRDFETPDDWGRAEKMTDLVNLLMLIAASLGSMAFGVLAAYGVLRAGFALMRSQQQGAVVKARTRVARV